MATNRVEFLTCRMNFDLIMYERLIFPPSPVVHFFERLGSVDFFILAEIFKLILIDCPCVPDYLITKVYREYLSTVSKKSVIPRYY
jgi:hypothetical protein